MSDSTYPYINHMNILHQPLERIDIPALVTACKDRWYNQTLCQVNDSVCLSKFNEYNQGVDR